MATNHGSGKPEEKAAAVRMVRNLRAELGTEHGTVRRVASQLGYGVESVRMGAKQADVDDGHVAGVSTAEARRVRELEQEVRELRRANEILKRAASFIIGIDQRGSGSSRPLIIDALETLPRHTTRRLLEDIEEIRSMLDIQQWVVAGVSWGTTLSLAYALAHPDRVRALALVALTTSSRA